MRAVQIDVHGGPEVLTVREVADPQPGPGEVLIRTVASSLNPVDWKTRAWDVGPAFPMTLGWDLAGVVVGGSSARFAVGDRVIAMSAQVATGRGTWAELVSLPEHLVTRAPATLTLAEAATLPLAGTTAVQALAALKLESRTRLLVTGGAGAVGGLAVQLARRAGVAVDALVSRPEHLAPVRELGAETVVDMASDLPEGVYDAVLDTAGADVSAALAAGGLYVSISDDPLPDVPGAAKSYVQESEKDLAELVQLVDAGRLRVRVAAHHPFTEVRAAHEQFEAGGLSGKVVLLF
ncbi:zinc-binding dehydrogenase [Streptomyces sp. SID486]|uniref:NADP-dependent oxidoreductase n=1 Tax=unclassified Streptomyces TaxID=2593676 RepID=UPI00136DD65F|nr:MULTISPECIES: NADP-dependent oxidoreductase [unclassified Streptomyces]MYW44818.1 zinc-binding dehydrogenase [Streptomyces sp. SID161]MYY00387.1 zinc-binding dehydrogenase [Streptomyces sp. SID486]